jgi:probable F420-dependent oxidoreductase
VAGTSAATLDGMKIGLMLPLGESETDGWPTLRAMALAAEESGLDSVWGADHLIFRDEGETEGIHECWTVLTAVAAITERVEVGPMVLALPFRNPALVAKMAAELDEVSGGRLILGLGCGWHEPEFTEFDYPFDHRVGRFEEGMRIVAPLLREGTVDFAGEYHRAATELLPRPTRPGGPPILIAGKQPRMLRIVAEFADQWNGAWYGTPETADDLRTRITNLHAAMDEAGRARDSIELTAGILVSFATEPDPDIPEKAIHGTTEEVADALAGYAELGVSHLISHTFPRTPDAVRRLGEAAALARERVPAAV